MSKAIILCGFMGSGKTTVGHILARRLLARFIDTDQYIEQQQKMSIVDIFQSKGEPYFRALEHLTLQNIIQSSNPLWAVIATGGGMLVDPDNIRLVQEADCPVVYLSTDFEICYDRICHSDRPLVRRLTKDQLHDLYEERHKIYSSVCTAQFYNHQKPETTAENIISLINPLSIQKL